MRDYSEEKKMVYDALIQIEETRSKKEKGKKTLLAEVRDFTKLSTAQCSNALKWLKLKKMVTTVEGHNGWIPVRMKKKDIEKMCWKHGQLMVRVSQKSGLVCAICERNKKKEVVAK